LYTLLIVVVISLAASCSDRQPPNTESWSYSRFIQEVEQNQVAKVRISADRSNAEVTTRDGRRVQVNLTNDPEFLNILVDHQVDITVRP
jgi:cell division protease FtsH